LNCHHPLLGPQARRFRMDLTKLRLQSADITSFKYEDLSSNKKASTSGFLKIILVRKEEIEASKDRLLMLYTGTVTAFEGEETPSPKIESKVMNLHIEFSMKYSGVFDINKLPSQSQEAEWLFKKDAGVFLHSVVNRFLADTTFKAIQLPHQ